MQRLKGIEELAKYDAESARTYAGGLSRQAALSLLEGVPLDELSHALAFLLGRGRLAAVSAHCDHPPCARAMPRATSSLVQAEGKSAEDVEAQVQGLLARGVTDFHPIDAGWLRRERPGLLLTQDISRACFRPAAIGISETHAYPRWVYGISIPPTSHLPYFTPL